MEKGTKTVLIISAVAVTLLLGFWAVKRFVVDKVTAARKKNRNIEFERDETYKSYSNASGSFNALKVKVPQLSTKAYENYAVSQITAKLSTIKNNYGNFITNAAKLTNVPEEIIYSFIFIESSGDKNAIGGISVGLMQINPATASDVIYSEIKKGRLSAEEEAVLRKQIGVKMDCLKKQKYSSHGMACNNNTGISVTKQDLLNAEFNIMVGAIALGQLIDEYTEGGTVRLDKVVIVYNQGIGAKKRVAGKDLNGVVSAAGQSKTYIIRLLGTNGLLDIQV